LRQFNLGAPTREAYGKTLVELGKINKDIVVLDADLSKSTHTAHFGKAFPDRFFNVGIAEANMTSIAAGLAFCGKIPFISSFACFLMCKAFEQIRMGITYSNNNVKIVVSHGGISVGEDGPSQQSVEDIALALALPGMVAQVPADEFATAKLVKKAAEYKGPVFIRTGRPKVPIIYNQTEDFEFGKAKILENGSDAVVFANGLMVSEALKANDLCKQDGLNIYVVDVYSVRPLDSNLIIKLARETGAVVTAEEHLKSCGVGTQIAKLLAENCPVPVEFVGIDDTYAESGKPGELLTKYHLTADDIRLAVRQVINKKNTKKVFVYTP
jgi:transketolase